MKIELSKLTDYNYYSNRLLFIQGDEGLIKYNYNNRFVQREINKLWNNLEIHNKPVLLIILKARRHGVSTYVQSRMFHKCHTKTHRHGITIAADDKGCMYIHNMAHTFYEYLPEKLKPETRYKSKSELLFDLPQRMSKGGLRGLKSSMRTVSCTDKAGLGTGQHFIHFSEYSNYRDAESVRKAVIPTAFKAPGTFIIIESTANGMVGKGEAFFNEWNLAKTGKSAFRPLFFSWLKHENYKLPLNNKCDIEEIKDTIDAEEKYLLDEHNTTLEQLKWRRQQIKLLGQGKGVEDDKSGIENFHEQYPTTDIEAFIVSGKPIFDRMTLKKYKEKVRDPIWIGDVVDNRLTSDSLGKLFIWEYPIEKEKYIVSIDACSGEPGATDFAAIEVFRVLDKRSGLMSTQSAEWHGKIGSEELAKIGVFLSKMYNNATIAPEVFGYGHAVLSEITKLEYWNVYKRIVTDSITKQKINKYGWKTDATTKPMLLTYGRYVINERMVVINSERLIDEMMIYVRDEGGSGAKAYGRGKDDLVDTFLINMKVIDIEYGDYDMDSIGIINSQKEYKKEYKDKLHYDTFEFKKEHKSWLEL